MSEKLEQMDLHDVVRKLTGRIDPIGETNEDDRRFNNLEAMILLVDKLTFDLFQVTREGGTHMGSVRKAVNRAREFLRDLKDALDDDELEALP